MNITRQVMGPVAPSAGLLSPLGIDEVSISGGFWAARQHANEVTTLGHLLRYLESEGWLANFDMAAAGTLGENRRGREFSDSEVYKYLEALAWELGRKRNAELEQDFLATVARVSAAQEPDGYLNTNFGRHGQAERWSDLEMGHELYCLGHLFQAAVARERTAPGSSDGLLGIATRAADFICTEFGPDGNPGICGHPVVEMGLAELGRVCGESRYIEQAALFIDRRGHGTVKEGEWGSAYYQDDVPIRQADALRGHAVRANYLSSGAVDVAVETSDDAMLGALSAQWVHTIARRTYITGGQGSRHRDEAFGEDWVLPPDRAYSETCAGIASVQFAWRLLLAQGGAHHADLIERTLYNVVATSPSETGDRFFYANTLYQRTPGIAADAQHVSPRASSSMRAPWFEVTCCPPNVARTFAQLAAYLATTDSSGVQIHQYAPSTISARLADGTAIELELATEYPFAGDIVVTVRESSDHPWRLSMRVPEWAGDAQLTVEAADGSRAVSTVAPGYAVVDRVFMKGDRVRLQLDVSPRLTFADPRIDAIRGCVAVEAGPLVYCVESVDATSAGLTAIDDDLSALELDVSLPLARVGHNVLATLRVRNDADHLWPYIAAGSADASEERQHDRVREVSLVPYNSWSNRGPSTMRVWLPVASE